MLASLARRPSVHVLLALCLLVSVVRAEESQAIKATGPSAANRNSAPDFALADANGTTIRLASYKGHVVLLDFWATWCTGCKIEIPWFMEFQQKYAAQGLRSIGVAMDEEGWDKVKPYLAAHPINYPIVLGNPDLVKPYQIANMPVTLLIDRQGKVADAHIGVVDEDAWEKEIVLLLKEQR